MPRLPGKMNQLMAVPRALPHLLPAPLANWFRTRFGKHFSRFALVAILSLATTQVVLAVAYQIVGTGGTATLIGWLAGAVVSYLLSRRAWDRRGRPDLVREALPFWLISAVTGLVLTTTGHFAGVFAKSHGFAPLAATAIVGGAVLLANVVTFVLRFLIFHYVLFAARPPAAPDAESLPDPVPVAARNGQPEQDPEQR